MSINLLDDETREMKRKWKAKMKVMIDMKGKVSEVQESLTVGEDVEENKEDKKQ